MLDKCKDPHHVAREHSSPHWPVYLQGNPPKPWLCEMCSSDLCIFYREVNNRQAKNHIKRHGLNRIVTMTESILTGTGGRFAGLRLELFR